VKRSDEAGYRDYVTARMEVLRRTGYLLCRDWHLADDLVSITIGKLYRHWPRARQMAHLDAYVRRILVRTWLDEKGRAWRREEPAETLPEPAVLPNDDVVARLGLLELLDALPGGRGAALLLRPLRRGDGRDPRTFRRDGQEPDRARTRHPARADRRDPELMEGK
jgi:DNA-directed RNA polymerase specialized sigma24 family protein